MSLSVSCPFCNYELQVEQEYIENNDLLYCGNCTKTFILEEAVFDPSSYIDVGDFEES